MAKTNERAHKLIVKILWCGADLGQSVQRLDRVRSVRAGRGMFSDIRSGVWPLQDDMVIIERNHGRLYLNPDLPWDGVVANGDDISIFNSSKRTRKTVEITRQTTASLKIEDVSVAIRVGNLFPSEIEETKLASGYRASILNFITDRRADWGAIAGAVVFSSILTGGFSSLLFHHKVTRPQGVADIPERMQLPFIAPHHFESAPNIIQDKLNRFDYVRSVTGYYHDFTELLLTGKLEKKGAYLFSGTQKAYEHFFQAQESSLAQLEAAQKSLTDASKRNGKRFISLPVALGESAEGSLQRILDKAALVRSSAAVTVDARRAISVGFDSDPGYDYGPNAKKEAGPSNYQKKLEDIRNTAVGELPEKDQQHQEAHRYALEAANVQLRLFKEGGLGQGVTGCCDPQVAIKAGSTPVIWEATGHWTESDLNLASLKASKWGTPLEGPKKEKITEPLAGVVDQKAVEIAIRQGKFQLQLCFELALRRNQAAQGFMEWKWLLDTRGQVSALSLVKSNLRDNELTQCVRDKIASWRFPKAKGGRVEIRYPFEFIRDKG